MTNELQYNITKDLISIEYQMGSPTFTWESNSYPFVPSVTEFKRDLDTGGFILIKLMSSTVRLNNLVNHKLEPIFISSTPTAQQKITYSVDGLEYRIESIKFDPTKSYFRMIAEGTAKGI